MPPALGIHLNSSEPEYLNVVAWSLGNRDMLSDSPHPREIANKYSSRLGDNLADMSNSMYQRTHKRHMCDVRYHFDHSLVTELAGLKPMSANLTAKYNPNELKEFKVNLELIVRDF